MEYNKLHKNKETKENSDKHMKMKIKKMKIKENSDKHIVKTSSNQL